MSALIGAAATLFFPIIIDNGLLCSLMTLFVRACLDKHVVSFFLRFSLSLSETFTAKLVFIFPTNKTYVSLSLSVSAKNKIDWSIMLGYCLLANHTPVINWHEFPQIERASHISSWLLRVYPHYGNIWRRTKTELRMDVDAHARTHSRTHAHTYIYATHPRMWNMQILLSPPN